MSNEGKAVFLSYASQDADAARKISESLRGAGVEVWFDADGGLEHGDEWDQKIRKQIKECVLFIPIISANTQARLEGYFRLEWELAAQRAMSIASGVPFILPVVIDDTREPEALVPDRFRAVQWTRLRQAYGGRGADIPPDVLARFVKLWSQRVGAAVAGVGDPGPASARPATSFDAGGTPAHPGKRRWRLSAIAAAVAIIGIASWVFFGRAASSASNPKPQTQNSKPSAPTAPAESAKLVLQARALIDDDWLAVRENFRNADDLCERATKLDPLDGEAWATWARVSAMLVDRDYDTSRPRRDAARSRAERALQLAPASIEAGLAMALVLAQNGSLPDATQRLKELLQRAPTDWRVARALAFTYSPGAKPGKPEGTEIRLHHPSFRGRDPRPLLDEARSMHDTARQLARCEELMAQANALGPSWEGYAMGLAYNIFSVCDLDAAAKLAQELPPRLLQEDVFAALVAKLWVFRGDGEKARAALARVPRDFIEDRWFFQPTAKLVGDAYELSNRHAAATEQWKQALTVVEKRLQEDPGQRDMLGTKALLLAKLGRKDESLQTWHLAREMGGLGNSSIIESLIHLANGDREQAIQGLLRSYGSVPEVALVSLNMLRLEPAFAPIRSDPRIAEIITKTEAMVARLRRKPDASGAKTSEATPTITVDQKSVAVLAFENLSDDKANGYFSDGISEELLNVLAKIPALKVSARTSAFSFKGRNVPIPEIAQKLGVAYVVEGSVRKAGGQVRITAQLIQAEGGFHVWSETFTRELKDIFAVQDEIAGLIARQLSLKIDASSAAARAPVNPEAFELYVQARDAWRLRTAEALDRAEKLLARVLALEPNFARAHAALADVWLVRGQLRFTLGRFDQRASPAQLQLVAKAKQALALDADSAEAHAAVGGAHWIGWNAGEAERELRRAVALNPSFASAHHFLGRALLDQGYVDEALAELKRAVELDPLSSRIADNYGAQLTSAGRYREALVVLDRALALQPENLQANIFRVGVLITLGRGDEALRDVRSWPADTALLGPKAYFLIRAGQREEGQALLAKPEAQRTMVPSSWFGIEPPEAALARLDPAEENAIFAGSWLYSPEIDPVRRDPRFLKFIDTLGLAEAHTRAQAWRAAHPPDSVEPTKKSFQIPVP